MREEVTRWFVLQLQQRLVLTPGNLGRIARRDLEPHPV